MEVERKMGSLAVVVIDVLLKNQLQVALAEDEQPVKGFVTQGFDHALAMGVSSRAPVGCEGDPGALAAEHLIELVDKLGISVVDGKSDWSLDLVQLLAQVSCLLRYPGRVGMGGAVGAEDAPTADLEKDQYVESAKKHYVDSEEVAGQDRAGVGAEELRPGRAIAARCWRNPMPAKDTADGGRRDPISELEQLALNAAITPTWVFPAQTQNQFPRLI
jgi:hypothetical protein